MLDKKSLVLLKTLNKLAAGTAYKVITAEELIASLTQKSLYDYDTIKETLDFLEKQEYINIKFSEENTYCYSLLPKARIYLEQDGSKLKQKNPKLSITTYIFNMISSFVGTFLAMFIFIYLFF